MAWVPRWRVAGLVIGLVVTGSAAAALAGWFRVALALLAVLLGGLVLALVRLSGQLAARDHQLRVRIDSLRAGQAKLRTRLYQRSRAIEREQVAGERRVTELIQQTRDQMVRHQRDQVPQTEALFQLYRQVEPVAPMPPSGWWALNPAELLELWYVLQRRRPQLVLELGSGTSSVWLGYALRRHGGRLVSVEHDRSYAEQTRAHLRRHGLTERVEVRHVPLVPVTVDGEPYQWYDPDQLTDLSGVDLLVVDGPPGGTGAQARYPALPLLVDRLAPGATVLLDDLDRADEREIAQRWCRRWPGLRRAIGTAGHLAVFTFGAEPGRISSGDGLG
jgi:protein-L-isoaspartate O-methyltransferase